MKKPPTTVMVEGFGNSLAPHGTSLNNSTAEAALLGAMLCDNRLVEPAADSLVSNDFSEAAHQIIFAAILSQVQQGKLATAVTLKPYMSAEPVLDELGGPGYLAKLSGEHTPFLQIADLIRQVRELSQRRQIIAGLLGAASKAEDLNTPYADIIALVDTSLAGISGHSDGIVQASLADAHREMCAAYDEPQYGVTSAGALASLDGALGPIRPHHLDILAGRPGMGKTATAISYALAAARTGHGVLFVSLEMSRLELVQRATADLLFDDGRDIPYDQIRDGRFAKSEARKRVYAAGRRFRDLPFRIVDAATMTIGRLHMIVRRHRRRVEAAGGKLDLVVVDYLQLLRPDTRTNSSTEAVSEVSRGLKTLAKENDLGVLALAQLNRGVEQREDKRPMLSDLRDSGQIEQDADAVVFLYREEYYLRKSALSERDPGYEAWLSAVERVAGEIQFIVAKRRNGPEGAAKGAFYGQFQAVRG